MNDVILKGYVTRADGNIVKVKVDESEVGKKLIAWGFLFDEENTEYILEVQNIDEKGNILSNLRNLGVGFSGGREWCPAEVFEYLRDLGIVSGKYIKIAWKGPCDVYLEER
jgi:Fe2+ transport system protein FeoA